MPIQPPLPDPEFAGGTATLTPSLPLPPPSTMSARASGESAPLPQTTAAISGAKRGRPRLTDEERERRVQLRSQLKEDKKTVHHLTLAVVKNTMAPSARGKRTKAGGTPVDAPDGASLEGAPADVTSLSVAQKALDIGFGEGAPPPHDAPVLRRPGQRLPENVKRFILICNGCAMPPREIILEVKERFGLVITSPQVARYDPTTAAGQTLCDE